MKESRFMLRAIELARKGELTTQPNPMVGCVIVKNNTIIGEGWHQSYGGHHAEVEAIKSCKKRFGAKQALKLLQGSDLYVNLEPCSITNNTPPCVDAVIRYGIKRVVCGTLDPNPRINGAGITLLKKADIKTAIGMLKKECEALNRIFFINQKKARPYIILKAAQSLDGKIALRDGASSWISNSLSRQDTHLLRARVKGILVGKNTALSDNPNLTMRLDYKQLGLKKNTALPQPIKIILGNLTDVKSTKNLFAKNAKVIIGSRGAGLQKRNVEHIQYLRKNFLEEFMQDLLKRGVTSILVEGGQETMNAFISNNLFDELVLYTAPIILGKNSLSGFNSESPIKIKDASALKLQKVETFNSDIKATYFAGTLN